MSRKINSFEENKKTNWLPLESRECVVSVLAHRKLGFHSLTYSELEPDAFTADTLNGLTHRSVNGLPSEFQYRYATRKHILYLHIFLFFVIHNIFSSMQLSNTQRHPVCFCPQMSSTIDKIGINFFDIDWAWYVWWKSEPFHLKAMCHTFLACLSRAAGSAIAAISLALHSRASVKAM